MSSIFYRKMCIKPVRTNSTLQKPSAQSFYHSSSMRAEKGGTKFLVPLKFYQIS